MSNSELRVRASAVIVHDGHLLTFLAKDPTSGQNFFFLPGGGVEDHETAPEAAIRETFEETGYKISIDPSLNMDAEYKFFWDGKWRDVLTIFYRGELLEPAQNIEYIHDASYNLGPVWLPLAQVPVALGYSQPILLATIAMIEI
jgi:8-oxo-dGTP pyrophosphatase MutT (NUDIX family)